MKNLVKLSLFLVLLTASAVKAEVTFLADAPENRFLKDTINNTQKCQNAGYTHTSCQGALVDECPYHNGYYKTCCPAGYLHRLSECASDISSDNCHGFYKCNTQFYGMLEPIEDGGQEISW